MQICQLIAAMLNDLPLEQWTAEHYKIAKNINYDIEDRRRGVEAIMEVSKNE